MRDVLKVKVIPPPRRKQKKKINWQAIATFITAIIATLGIVVSFLTYLRTEEERSIQRAFAQNARFSDAVERLESKSLYVRMAGLFELRQIGLDDQERQESIIRILGPFIRDGIENRELILTRREGGGANTIYRPKEDVFLAAEISSLFWKQIYLDSARDTIFVDLNNLQAENIDLSGIDLKGANLMRANFQDSNLFGANFYCAFLSYAEFQGALLSNANFQYAELAFTNLQDTSLFGANFQNAFLFIQARYLRGANLQHADLRGVRTLFGVQQLLEEAFIDDTTLIDPSEDFDRLHIQQNQTPTE